METLPGLDLQEAMDAALSHLFLMLRPGAFLAASPVFGGRFVPLPVRIMAAAVIALALAGRVPAPDVLAADAAGLLTLLPAALAEIAVGVCAGLALTIVFAAAAMAGDRIAATAGLSLAAQVDPAMGGTSPVLAQAFNLALLSVFVVTDGHLVALRMILDSMAASPPGTLADPVAVIGAGMSAGAAMFALAAQATAPVVGVLLLVNVVVGLLTRSAPTLNVFSFGFPLMMTATLILLWLTAPSAVGMLERIVQEGLAAMAAVLEAAHG